MTTKDDPGFGAVAFELSDDDRNLLVEALGGHAWRYRGHAGRIAERCTRIANQLEAARPAAARSTLDPAERTLVRRALQTHAFDTRGWDTNDADAERRAAIALDTRLCADEAEYAMLQALDDEPPTQRTPTRLSSIPPLFI